MHKRNERLWHISKKITWHLGHYHEAEPDFNNEAILIYNHLLQELGDIDE